MRENGDSEAPADKLIYYNSQLVCLANSVCDNEARQHFRVTLAAGLSQQARQI